MFKDQASHTTIAQAYVLAKERRTVQVEHVAPQSQTTLSKSPRIRRNIFGDRLPRLQIINASTSSKPNNYWVSPATPLTVNGLTSIFKDMSVFKDWSGRGSHVDFLPEEVLPLKEGRFLGHGIMGGVYETAIGDYTFAWKRRFCRRKITRCGEERDRNLEETVT